MDGARKNHHANPVPPPDARRPGHRMQVPGRLAVLALVAVVIGWGLSAAHAEQDPISAPAPGAPAPPPGSTSMPAAPAPARAATIAAVVPQDLQPAPDDPERAGATPFTVVKLIRQLDARADRVRREAVARLAGWPTDIAGALIARLDAGNARVSGRQRVLLLGVLAQRRIWAPKTVLGALPLLDAAGARGDAAGYFRRFPGGFDAVARALFGAAVSGAGDRAEPTTPPARDATLEALWRRMVADEILDVVLAQTEALTLGYYPEQYRSMFRFGEPAVAMFGKLARNADSLLAMLTSEKRDNVRRVAVQALGDSRIPAAVPELLTLWTYFSTGAGRYYASASDLSNEIAFGLAKLGDNTRAAPILKRLERNARLRGASASEDYAHALLRVARYTDAVAAYRQAITRRDAQDDSLAITYYNLACAYSRGAALPESLAALQMAVAKGYDDFEWMFQDGDLHGVRGVPAFAAWITELRGQPQFAGRIPAFSGGAVEDGR